jgi:hypothetical protein
MVAGRKLSTCAFSCAILLSCVSQPAPLPNAREPVPSEVAVQSNEQEFVVTKDMYAKTFAEVEAFIFSLNAVIRDRKYEEWLASLSTDYISVTGNPEFLRQASQSAALKADNVVLKTLKDYFLYVVVPSRSQATLSEISFIDAEHVKASTIIDGTPVVLYKLVKKDAHWMVGIW